MRRYNLLLLIFGCLYWVQTVGQAGFAIKGIVVNEQHKPLSGVSLALLHQGQATLSDVNGSFSLLLLHSRDTLLVTAMSYRRINIPLTDQTACPLTIILHETPAEMREVLINTGYQTVSKERSTGAFTQVSQHVLLEQTGSNILNRLNGTATSVLFDNNPNRPSITVRGVSTINGYKDPLIILDNFPYDGDINNINPNDVQSISILKDAAAASIWGTRAGNGVIVITTKKGSFNKPLQIQFSANLTANTQPNLWYTRPIATSDFIDVEKLLYSQGYYNAAINNVNKPALTPVVELLLKASAGSLSQTDADKAIDALRNNDIRKTYAGNFYQTSINQQYALSFNGGNRDLAYRFSVGYDQNISNTAARYQRFSLKTDNSFRLTDRLQLTTGITYTFEQNQSGKPAYGGMVFNGQTLYPYARFTDTQGNGLSLNVYRKGYTDTAGAGKLLDWLYYPMEDYKHATMQTKTNDLLFNASLQYKIGSGLQLSVQYRHEYQNAGSDNLSDISSFAARDMTNRFSQLNRATGVVKYIVPKGGLLNRSITAINSDNARLQVDYNKTFGSHTISLLGGMEIKSIRTHTDNTQAYGYNPDLLTQSPVDYANPYPNFLTGTNQFIVNNNSMSERLYHFTSVYGNGAYTYRNKYTLSVSARKDESNLFGVSANDKGVPLWSAGLAWQAAKERFFQPVWLSQLTLRATYGFSGNVDPNKSAVTTLNYLSAAPVTGYSFATVSQFANPSLRWEKVAMWNIGLDFTTTFGLGGSIDYYHKRGLDLFGQAPIDYTTGLGTNYLLRNTADMTGKGLDIELNVRPIGHGLTWSSILRFSYNTTRITAYYLASTQGSLYINNGSNVSPIVGKPVYSILSYQWAGLDPNTGNPIGIVAGQPTNDYSAVTGSKTQVSDLVGGSALPVYFGSFSQTIAYKQFSLLINIGYKFAYLFRRESINYASLVSSAYGNADYADRWQHPGDEKHTSVPAFLYPLNNAREQFYANSAILAVKGDHIRLQYITLSYTFTKPLFKKLPACKPELYINAANLGILWRANKYGIDPDYNTTIPSGKTFSTGIRFHL